MILEQLAKLGFSQKEAMIYSTLYQRGPSPVSTLANLTKIKRTSVYDILNSLSNRGLIISFKQGTYTYFAIDDINKIFLEQKEKTNIANQLIQELKNSTNISTGFQINYYKGHEGFTEMHEDILKAKPDEILGFMNMEEFYKGLNPYRDDEWTKERTKAKIKARLILVDSKLAREMQKEDKKLNREIKLIPKNRAPFTTSCNIYKDHIVFFDSANEVIGIRIHHPAFYQMQKQLFEIAWSHW